MIYLDNAATTFPKPDAVYRAMEDFVRSSGANPGRSGHRRAAQAEAMIDETRRLLARLFGAARPERVVFGPNATDALNMAIKGIVRAGDHVITSVLEHNSVNRPLNRLERDGLITITRLPATAAHLIDPEAVAAAWRPATRLVAITLASNVTGTVLPVGEYGRIVRERDGLLLVDAAQGAGIVPIDVQAELIDLLGFTGHKALLGPTGTGGLVVGERADVATWREGGTGGDSSDPQQPREFPHRLEAGTPNVFGLAGLREGARIVLEHGVERLMRHEHDLLVTFLQELRQPELFSFYGADRMLLDGPVHARVGLLSFNVAGFAPAELAAILDQHFDIAVRSGVGCAPYAHKHLGTFPEGAVRVSVGMLTTQEEMREAAAALNEVTAA